MTVDSKKVGAQIAMLRKHIGLTQNELGERLSISYQAVSKWERGETIPDVGILLDLAEILRTTVDNILSGGEKIMEYKRVVSIADIREGIECFEKIGDLLGRESLFYIGAMEGVSQKMNMEFEKSLSDNYTKEAMIAEAAEQAIVNGAYIDLSDIKKSFTYEHWVKTVSQFAEKYGIK